MLVFLIHSFNLSKETVGPNAVLSEAWPSARRHVVLTSPAHIASFSSASLTLVHIWSAQQPIASDRQPNAAADSPAPLRTTTSPLTTTLPPTPPRRWPGGGQAGRPAARGRAGLPPHGRHLVFCIYLVYLVYICIYLDICWYIFVFF